MLIDTRTDTRGIMDRQTHSYLSDRINKYKRRQPWIRRSNSPYDASIESIYPKLRDHSQLSDERKDNLRRHMAGVRKDWRDIRSNWRGHDSWQVEDLDDIYDASARTSNVYGDFAETLLEHSPTPGDLSQADRVMHVMRETKGKSMSHALPEVGEEGVIVGGENHRMAVFDDGSVYYIPGSHLTYAPGSKGSKEVIGNLVARLKTKSSDSSREQLERLEGMASSKPTPRFWSGFIDTQTHPDIVEAVEELKNKQNPTRVVERRMVSEGGLPSKTGYRGRRGRGGQDMRR